MILNCFISGLILEIRKEISVLQPTFIMQAMGLTKLLESKINDSKPYPSFSPKLPQPSHHLLPPPCPPFPTTLTPTPSPLIPIKKTHIRPTSRALSCWIMYNYDEIFFTCHKCTTSCFLLLLSEESLSKYIPEPYSNICPYPKPDNPSPIHLSFQALSTLLLPIPLNLKVAFLTSLLLS